METKRLHHIHVILMALATVMALLGGASCRDRNDFLEYTGSNEIAVVAGEVALTPILKDSIEVTLARAVAKETQEVTISVEGNQEGILEFPSRVAFEGTARKVSFFVRLKAGATVASTFWPNLTFALQPGLTPQRLQLTVNKEKPVYKPSTDEEELIKHWVEKGYPLDKILSSYLPVEVTVSWPTGGGIVEFREAGRRSYRGVTMLSLSKVATKDSLVLKFDWNALGLTQFFYFALRKMTIENDEFWFDPWAGPLYAKVMKLLNWDRASHEEFECTLDSVAIGRKDANGISRVNTLHETYKDPMRWEEFKTPFWWSYSAWDRMENLIAQGNPIALECSVTDATPFPERHLNALDCHHSKNSRLPPYVSEFDGVTPFPEQVVTIDWNTGAFQFHILSNLNDATGGYLDIVGKVQLPVK